MKGKTPYNRVFTLIVGIGNYPNPSDRLDYAESDARAVAAELAQQYGFSSTKLLVNSEATRAAIFAELDRIQAELDASKQDDFIFYFSGHGLTGVESEADGKTNRAGFLLPYGPDVSLATRSVPDLQAKAISLKDLVDKIRGMNKARHRIVLLDSCFSGLAFKDQKISSKISQEPYAELIALPTIQLMTAGLEGEFALEDSKLKQSVFTAALLKQFRESKVRTVEEIFFPINLEVRDYFMQKNTARGMTPQHRYIDLDRGTFVFVPKNSAGWDTLRSAGYGSLSRQLGSGKAKGVEEVRFEGEVTSEELHRVKYKRYELTDRELELAQQRFEYRASLGDPMAAIANAEMYRHGLGVKRDPARSQIWQAEATDARNAGTLPKDVEKALAVMTVFQGGRPDAAGIGGLISLFDKGAVEDFRGAVKNLAEKLDKRERDEAILRHAEVRKILGEIVAESGGKVKEADVTELRALVDLIGEQIKFGAFQAAHEDLAEAAILLVPIAEKFPKKDENKTGRNPFGF